MFRLALAIALLFATDDAVRFLNLVEEPRDFVVAEWKAGGKDLWVVAGMYEEEMQAAVLRKRGDDFELVARSEGETPELTMVFAEILEDSDYFSGTGKGTSVKRIVIVSKTKTEGFYDLLVRDRKTKKTTTWRWNGTAYAR